MAKLLIIKEKRQEVDGRQRTVIKGKQYIVRDMNKDFETTYGTIKKADLKKKGIVKSSTGKEFVLVEAGFSDLFKRLRKLPQAMNLKELGAVAAETGVNKDSIVVDAGTGSGHTACYLANICKHVYTYEIKEENIDVAKENAKFLDLKNITFYKKSLYDGIKEKNVDMILLDLPNPVKVIDHAIKALKTGGNIVIYSLCLQPLEEFIAEAKNKKELLCGKTIELIERKWKIQDKITRPDNIEIGHTGFLTFIKRIV